MKPEEALRNIGDWISEETQKRKYDKVTLIELADSLIVIKRVVEEQIPKKPDGFNDGCWGCGEFLSAFYDHPNYCPNCGQAIDWTEELE